MKKENVTALVPLNGGEERIYATVTQPKEENKEKEHRRLLRHLCAIFCALSSLFFSLILFVLLLYGIGGADVAGIALRLAESTFLGTAYITIAGDTPIADGSDFPLPGNMAEDTRETAVPSETTLDTSGQAVPPLQEMDRYPICRTDLSCSGDIFALSNETAYTPDTSALFSAILPFPTPAAVAEKYGEGAPYILILHTHGTEAYAAEGALSYSTTDAFRSDDREENTVAVGAVMAEVFQKAGIPTLHATDMLDAESYRDSYTRAAALIRTYLEKYPSIQVVLDVHRDSVIRADLTKMQPLTKIDGEEYAQFMIVAGTDEKGADFPHWKQNLSFALKIQSALSERSDSLTRPINLRGAAFNQQYTAGSLLLEIGSCGNTLAQAKRTAALVAEEIAGVLQ